MNVRIPNIIRWYPVMSTIVGCAVIGSCMFLYNYYKKDNRIPVALIGVHHFGSDYLISTFFVDGYGGGNVSEGGGGGGILCCVTIPRKWKPGLTAQVRWEVRHIIRRTDPTAEQVAEIDGIYQAKAPVEAYVEPGDLYVHFFPNGRVRIVVSETSPSGEQHPIQRGDARASETATAGSVIKTLFTAEEIAESERETARERAKYGDWR